MERTTKQKQATNRNRSIFLLNGMITNLIMLRDCTFRAYFLKGMANVCIVTLEQLRRRLVNLTDKNDRITRTMITTEKKETWHDLFNAR